MKRVGRTLLAAMVLAACSNVPRAASTASVASETSPVPSLFQSAQANDAADKGNWWRMFDDPQLDVLAQSLIANNPGLQVAAARLQQARAQAQVVCAGLFPQIALQAGSARQKSSADRPVASYTASNQSTVQNNQQLGFAVSYEADLFGRVESNIAGADALAEQARSELENTRLILLAELAGDYFSLRALEAELQVLSEAINLQQRAVRFMHDRHALGLVSGLDLAQQETVLAANRSQFELVQKQSQQFLHAIASLSGQAAADFHLAPAGSAMRPPALPQALAAEILQRRPDIASAQRGVAYANANIGVARAAAFPTLMLQANGGWNSNQWGNLLSAPSLLWSLGAALTQTVFDGGKTQAGIAAARAAHAAAVATYRRSVLSALQELADAAEGGVALARAAEYTQSSVSSAARVLALTDARYTGGIASYLDVITAQQSLLANQRQLVQIRGQQMLSAVLLVKASGGAWQVAAP